MHEPLKSFSFLVVAYNHEKYILEHLESIKFLIESYGSELEFQIIVNDDCSKDRTVFLIDRWLDKNSSLFNSVVRLYNEKNIGTCASILNMMGHAEGDYIKLTAGDDVYSFENLFMALPLLDKHSIVSGVPLDLTEGIISVKGFDVYNIFSSFIIYKNRPLIHRFIWLSNSNAPNIFYSRKYLLSDEVKDFVSGFDVVEDLPIQVAIAENYAEADFHLVDKVFVYYRRTLGSTYIVAGSRFSLDQQKIFNYLIDREENLFRRIVLKNRLICFLNSKIIVKRLLNISFYVYVISVAMNWFSIRSSVKRFDAKEFEHRKHYLKIVGSSKAFAAGWADEH